MKIDKQDPSNEDDAPVRAGIDFADPNSRLAPFYLRTSHVVAVVFLAAVFFFMTTLSQMWHTDVWAHLRFGEYMVQHRQLPTREPFSDETFADHEALYVNYQWLSQLGAYLLFDAGRRLAPDDFEHQLGGGVVFLQTAHALIVTLRLLVLLLAFRRLTGSVPFAVLGMALVAVMGWPNHIFIIRPQVLGELAFAALLLALSRPILSRRALFLVPVVIMLWANCHGTFPLGFVLLGIFLAGRVVEVVSGQWSVVSGQKSEFGAWVIKVMGALLRDVQTRRLVAVLVLSILAAMVNPHGPMLFRYSWELGKHPNIPSMSEWMPLPVKAQAGYIFLASVFLLIPLLRWSPTRFSATQVLLLVLFGWQTLAHARMLVWWIMIMVWVALPHAHAVYRRFLPPLLEETAPASLVKTIMAGLLAGVVLLWSEPAQWLIFRQAPIGSKRVDPVTPVKFAEELKERYRIDPTLGHVVFASETQGDYLLWALRLPEPVRIFCYTHVHLIPPEHWRECMAVKFGNHHWQEILDHHGVEFLIVERVPYHKDLIKEVEAASDHWLVLSEDNKQIFFAQRKHFAPIKRDAGRTP